MEFLLKMITSEYCQNQCNIFKRGKHKHFVIYSVILCLTGLHLDRTGRTTKRLLQFVLPTRWQFTAGFCVFLKKITHKALNLSLSWLAPSHPVAQKWEAALRHYTGNSITCGIMKSLLFYHGIIMDCFGDVLLISSHLLPRASLSLW